MIAGNLVEPGSLGKLGNLVYRIEDGSGTNFSLDLRNPGRPSLLHDYLANYRYQKE